MIFAWDRNKVNLTTVCTPTGRAKACPWAPPLATEVPKPLQKRDVPCVTKQGGDREQAEGGEPGD
eukprot:scaffold280558_cov48-Prasinocladus_malaysianus.AAC.1